MNYTKLWNTMIVKPEIENLAKEHITQFYTPYLDRYEVAEKLTKFPKYLIFTIHILECGQYFPKNLQFTRHFHNGDPLTGRTVRVPKGRPKTGKPPFTWEESVADALLNFYWKPKEWNIETMLEFAERYNGLGYKKYGINSPYLWSGTNHYNRGKFGSDGKFYPNLVSKQIGVAVYLKILI